GFFVPQTVVAIMNRLTEIDRNNSQFYLEESRQEVQAVLEGVRQKFNRELEDYREFGFTGDRDYKYNVKEEKYIQELAQFLGICHCILVGFLADRYHFSHADVRPKFPELLPSLLEKVPSENLKQMLVGEIVSSYQSLYQLAVGDRLHLIPDLYLDLALSLSHLPDQSWARKQIEYSIKVWLMLRNRVSAIEEQKPSLLELLEAATPALTVGDKECVETLGECDPDSEKPGLCHNLCDSTER
ncbi:MAG: hypothetical protein ACKPH7_03120, partial [Planktothrix sp.]